jgi:hypothetical protein
VVPPPANPLPPKVEPDALGARTVEIEGKLLTPVKDRPRNAPNYNENQVWKDLRDEMGLKGYEAAHLWGPGFGDEAAAGMMLAPHDVNQIWQNHGAESFLRGLADQAREVGGQVRVTARATSHGRDVPGGAPSWPRSATASRSSTAPARPSRPRRWASRSARRPTAGCTTSPPGTTPRRPCTPDRPGTQRSRSSRPSRPNRPDAASP